MFTTEYYQSNASDAKGTVFFDQTSKFYNKYTTEVISFASCSCSCYCSRVKFILYNQSTICGVLHETFPNNTEHRAVSLQHFKLIVITASKQSLHVSRIGSGFALRY